MADMLQSFRDRVAQSSFLSLMVNAPTVYTEHNAIRYLWDGYMDCWIVFDGELYWDLQDQVEIPPAEEYRKEYRSFTTLDALLTEMEKIGDDAHWNNR